MRIKIDYGIDLGTTNSAIARMENGQPVIKKSEVLMDTIPSCVHFNKKKNTLVGMQAFNALKNEASQALKQHKQGQSNSFIEFKRTMGSTERYYSSNMERNYSSEELSAQVLQKLRSHIQDDNFEAVVITVPAKFTTPQNEATKKAAELAGFQQVYLLQEPVAAATAYGLTHSNKAGNWLVFDFGGGTFDVALLHNEEGVITVKDTEGDNFLGGKNLDNAVIDELFIPYIAENYDIADWNEQRMESLRNALKVRAEECKIQLSYKDSHDVLTELGELGEDENGEEIELDLSVSADDLAHIFAPIFQKSIDLCQELLQRNGIRKQDLSALLLVGGPTHSPILRTMLREQITAHIDTSVDPMTVVARGAALYASTLEIEAALQEQQRDKSQLQLNLRYDASTVEIDPMVNVSLNRALCEGEVPEHMTISFQRSDGAFASPASPLTEKAQLVSLELQEGRANSFNILVRDDKGREIPCQPNQISILQGLSGLDDMQVLPYHVGIGRYFEEYEKERFTPVRGLEKNKTMPAVGTINGLTTTSEIQAGCKEDTIRIPIYQGDYNAEGSTPELNNRVVEVVITGEHFKKTLKKGSLVDLTIKVSKSGEMSIEADFPSIEHSETLEVAIAALEAPTVRELESSLQRGREKARFLEAYSVDNALQQLEQELENERANADGRLRLQETLRKQLLVLDPLEREQIWPSVERELCEHLSDLEETWQKMEVTGKRKQIKEDVVEKMLRDFRHLVSSVIKSKHIKEARDLTRDMGNLNFELQCLMSGTTREIHLLRIIADAFDMLEWRNKAQARACVDEALQRIGSGNNNVKDLMERISQNLILNEQTKGLLS